MASALRSASGRACSWPVLFLGGLGAERGVCTNACANSPAPSGPLRAFLAAARGPPWRATTRRHPSCTTPPRRSFVLAVLNFLCPASAFQQGGFAAPGLSGRWPTRGSARAHLQTHWLSVWQPLAAQHSSRFIIRCPQASRAVQQPLTPARPSSRPPCLVRAARPRPSDPSSRGMDAKDGVGWGDSRRLVPKSPFSFDSEPPCPWSCGRRHADPWNFAKYFSVCSVPKFAPPSAAGSKLWKKISVRYSCRG